MNTKVRQHSFRESQVYWDREEFGPEVTEKERGERAQLALVFIVAWDDVRKAALDTSRTYLLLNQGCHDMIMATGHVLKLNPAHCLQVMERTIEQHTDYQSRFNYLVNLMLPLTRMGWPKGVLASFDS